MAAPHITLEQATANVRGVLRRECSLAPWEFELEIQEASQAYFDTTNKMYDVLVELMKLVPGNAKAYHEAAAAIQVKTSELAVEACQTYLRGFYLDTFVRKLWERHLPPVRQQTDPEGKAEYLGREEKKARENAMLAKAALEKEFRKAQLGFNAKIVDELCSKNRKLEFGVFRSAFDAAVIKTEAEIALAADNAIFGDSYH